MTSANRALEAYFATVAAVDVRAASDLVLELFDEGTPVRSITAEVLVPAQVRVGQLWEQGTWSVADEHAATVVTDSALSALTRAAGRHRRMPRRHVLLACVEGEWHSLPARMAAAVAVTDDTRVTVLGPSVPADQLRRRLSARDVDLLALSCTMPTNLIGAARCIAVAHDLGVPVVVGGAAFGATGARAQALGADAWSWDAAGLLGPTPALSGRAGAVPVEALVLDAVDGALVVLAHERLVGALASAGAQEPCCTPEDLEWMARFTGAAVLVDDPTVVTDVLGWLCRRPPHGVSRGAVSTAAHILADTLEPVARTGAALLRAAAGQVSRRGVAG